MISVCIVLSLVIPRWDSILFPVFQGILFYSSFLAVYSVGAVHSHQLWHQILRNEETIPSCSRRIDRWQKAFLSLMFNLERIVHFLKWKIGAIVVTFPTGNKSSFCVTANTWLCWGPLFWSAPLSWCFHTDQIGNRRFASLVDSDLKFWMNHCLFFHNS